SSLALWASKVYIPGCRSLFKIPWASSSCFKMCSRYVGLRVRCSSTCVSFKVLSKRSTRYLLSSAVKVSCCSAMMTSLRFLFYCRSRFQQPFHVPLIGFHPRLAIRIDAHEPAFHHRGEHEHLHELAHVVLGERGQDQIGRGPGRFVIGLVGAAKGGANDVRIAFAIECIQFILVFVGHADHDGLVGRGLHHQVVDDPVARAVLMLLPPS